MLPQLKKDHIKNLQISWIRRINVDGLAEYSVCYTFTREYQQHQKKTVYTRSEYIDQKPLVWSPKKQVYVSDKVENEDEIVAVTKEVAQRIINEWIAKWGIDAIHKENITNGWCVSHPRRWGYKD